MRMGIKESGVLLALSIGSLIAFVLRPEIKRDIVTEQYKAELPQQEEPALIVGTLPEEPVAPAPVVEETKVQELVAEEIKTDPAASYEPRRVTGNGDLLELEPKTLRMFVELEQRWGEQLEIKWAYRSKELNTAIDGAKHSQHIHGKAIDITHNGWSQAKMKKFVRLAYEVGFRGFGLGQTMIHIDSRDELGAWLYPGSPYPSARKLLK